MKLIFVKLVKAPISSLFVLNARLDINLKRMGHANKSLVRKMPSLMDFNVLVLILFTRILIQKSAKTVSLHVRDATQLIDACNVLKDFILILESAQFVWKIVNLAQIQKLVMHVNKVTHIKS